jgi:hypothetical protein
MMRLWACLKRWSTYLPSRLQVQTPALRKEKKKSAMKDDVKASPFQDRESTEMFYLVDHRQK